jgi:hypothetical protein
MIRYVAISIPQDLVTLSEERASRRASLNIYLQNSRRDPEIYTSASPFYLHRTHTRGASYRFVRSRVEKLRLIGLVLSSRRCYVFE